MRSGIEAADRVDGKGQTTDPEREILDAMARLSERERLADANGIKIAYDEIGDPDAEPLVLIMGLATQLIHWDERFCTQLAERGYRVIRFDNRDCGHSSKIESESKPGTVPMLFGVGSSAYRLSDMATDVAGLMDYLELDAAHIAGASMGGMIAQTVAIEHPDRVRTLCSIMSTTGSRRVGLPRLRALGTLLSKPPRDRESYAEAVKQTFKVIGSPGHPADEDRWRALALAAYDRCFYPRGVARQLHAITSSGDRTKHLQELRVPTLVLHGREDPLVRPAGGRATAKAIPGAHLHMVDGMGHDLPPAVWPEIIEAIACNAQRAGPSVH